ncbi:UNVERIFIED_CONTAM: hypothetical protein Sradi_2523400 [Sesamum radiatum]|uniref:Uncharacterized protein n=1 Tax=Sesamum radiatum TaxID=300843 RepID=A0AAW2SKF0_SESRA
MEGHRCLTHRLRIRHLKAKMSRNSLSLKWLRRDHHLGRLPQQSEPIHLKTP